MLYVVGSLEENEILLYNVVLALRDSLNILLKNSTDKRTIIENVRGVHTSTRAWHTLKVALHGKTLAVELDGKQRLKRELDAAPSGRCGLWSKADSKVLFDDFNVTR